MLRIVVGTSVKGLVAVVAASAIAGLAPASAQARARACGFVGFVADSSDGAFMLVAQGVSCQTARSVARQTRPEHFRPPGGVRRFKAHGFACQGTDITSGIEFIRYRCRRGTSLVAFDRS